MMALGKSSFCLVLLLGACVPALLVSAADPDPLTDFTVPGNGARKTVYEIEFLRRIFLVARCLWRDDYCYRHGQDSDLQLGTST
jgi:hypothetical protein